MSYLQNQPNQPPFLFVSDDITLLSHNRIICRHSFDSDEWFFKCHWPHYPVMPGSLQQEAMTQLGGILLFQTLKPRPKHFLLRSVSSLLLLRGITPNVRILIEAVLEKSSKGIFKFQSTIRSETDHKLISKCKYSLYWEGWDSSSDIFP